MENYKGIKGHYDSVFASKLDAIQDDWLSHVTANDTEIAMVYGTTKEEAEATAQLFSASKDMAKILIDMIKRADNFKDSVGDNIYNSAKEALEKAGIEI